MHLAKPARRRDDMVATHAETGDGDVDEVAMPRRLGRQRNGDQPGREVVVGAKQRDVVEGGVGAKGGDVEARMDGDLRRAGEAEVEAFVEGPDRVVPGAGEEAGRRSQDGEAGG